MEGARPWRHQNPKRVYGQDPPADAQRAGAEDLFEPLHHAADHVQLQGEGRQVVALGGAGFLTKTLI